MKLIGMQVYLENDHIEEGLIEIVGDKITAVSSEIPSLELDDSFLSFPPSYKCLPGMIDGHIHGADGYDTMDATPEALNGIARALPAEGTTSFLATTITQSQETIEKALVNADEVMRSQSLYQAEILGLHLEGPFINKEKAGAQPLKYILDADLSLFKKWQLLSGDRIKCVTIAPEIKNAYELIDYLSSQGIVASIGHSNGTFLDASKAVSAGASQVTHLFNGMTGLHHREPGIAGAALMLDRLFVELIVDGLHVHPEVVNLSFQQIGSNRMILITDAMRAKCLNNGSYDLGGQQVTVKDGKAQLASGQLAGSVLRMNDAIRNTMKFTGADLTDIIKMGAENPAKQFNVYHRKGSIEAGKEADLIILNEKNDAGHDDLQR